MRVELLSTASALLMLAGAFWPFKLLADEDPLNLVDSVDLERYQGVWHEIARLPNEFQDQCAKNVTAEYTLLDEAKSQGFDTGPVIRTRQDG